MGTAAFETAAILGSKGNTKAKILPKNRGAIYVRVDKFVSSGSIRFKFSGQKLKNVEGMFGKSDPFYEIARKDVGEKGTEWNIVYRSQHIMNNLNPNWNEDAIELSDLCLGDLSTPLLISVYDFEKSGKVCMHYHHMISFFSKFC
jgi:Ca2+-dependent lipid-binding protein